MMKTVFLSFLLQFAHSALYTHHWAVEIKGGGSADTLAAKHGFRNLGQVGNLDGVYWFQEQDGRTRRSVPQLAIADRLRSDDKIAWAEQQEVRGRYARSIAFLPKDPRLAEQWYIKNKGQASGPPGLDHNIIPVWEKNLTGNGIVIGIVDDGVEHGHRDLAENYASGASYDFIDQDADADPHYNTKKPQKHGTRCAGIVASIANDYCGVGIAFRSKVASLRVLSKSMTDLSEANALSHKLDEIDIFSASWGPVDKGQALDGPGALTKRVMKKAVERGRHGKGTIYVWASGNGGRYDDSCGCDGYVTSIYTIGVSSVTDEGKSPWYAEWCPSTLISTYSSGEANRNKAVVTTDLHDQCTSQHTGTSASAPMAAAIIALMLEANPELTWRDVQHILVRTGELTEPHDGDWTTNGAGYKVNHKFGFGVINADKAVKMASTWLPIPLQRTCIQTVDLHMVPVPTTIDEPQPLSFSIPTVACRGTRNEISYLEHVVAVTSIKSTDRGSITVRLTSPEGTTSMLLPRRRRDHSKAGLKNWPFMTTHNWGENPVGKWKLNVLKFGKTVKAVLVSFELRFYGTNMDPEKYILHG